MKKFTALLLALVLAFSLSAVAFAATTSGATIKYDLSVNGSNDIKAKTGDVITVAYRISASESAEVMVSQNKIYYDPDFFRLVDNSNKASAGFTDFSTVHRKNLEGKWRVFFSTTATHTYDTSWSEIGTLQLEVIAKGGSGNVVSEEAIANDMNNQGYSLSLQNLKVTIGDDGQQKQFTVVFQNEDGSTYKTETVNEGASLTLPAGPAKANATFSHWSISGSQTKYLPGASYKPTGNVTFLPNWTTTANPDPNPGQGTGTGDCILRFETNGGSTIASIAVARGTRVDLSRYLPTRSGYSFAGWYYDAEMRGECGTVITVDASMTVYAAWKLGMPFVDVRESDWFYSSVEYVWSHGLMNGTSATLFSPKVSTTRGMIVTILARYDGQDTSGSTPWYAAGREWAMQNGVSDGTHMEREITREQLAAMLYRYAAMKGYDVSATADLSAYQDAASASAWAVDAMRWAVGAGLIQGRGASTLAPRGQATRAEVAAILMRFCQKIGA